MVSLNRRRLRNWDELRLGHLGDQFQKLGVTCDFTQVYIAGMEEQQARLQVECRVTDYHASSASSLQEHGEQDRPKQLCTSLPIRFGGDDKDNRRAVCREDVKQPWRRVWLRFALHLHDSCADFLPHSRHSIDDMMEELERHVAGISDSQIRRLVEEVLARPGVREGIRQAPAGKVMHHAYIGGLLEHIVSLARLADQVAEHYTWLDRSILMAGVLLHDIGKIAELSYRTGFGYTDEGQLVGHIVMGVTWIDEAARKLGDIDPDKVLEVKHLVASHHGKLEFGSPKTPMTAEAFTLHFLDNLDAKLAAFRQCYEDADMSPASVERWGDFNPMLGTRLYYPRRSEIL